MPKNKSESSKKDKPAAQPLKGAAAEKEAEKSPHAGSGTDAPRGEGKDVELFENELVIRFESRHELLPKLIAVAAHIGESHAAFLTQPGVTADVLGGSRARIIVSGCAKSNAWQMTLGELGLNLLIFRSCVHNGIDQAGYVPGAIPATADTRLAEVVVAIQDSPRKAL